jgi:hypothetical protein
LRCANNESGSGILASMSLSLFEIRWSTFATRWLTPGPNTAMALKEIPIFSSTSPNSPPFRRQKARQRRFLPCPACKRRGALARQGVAILPVSA